MSKSAKDSIVSYLVRKYGAHTVLLYGSNLDLNPGSDIDLMVFVEEQMDPIKDQSIVEGLELDAFIYTYDSLNLPKGIIRVRNSIALLDRINIACKVRRASKSIFDQGSAKLNFNEWMELEIWARKVLQRLESAKGVKLAIRRNELFAALIEAYFEKQNWWYEGASHADEKIKNFCVTDYEIFANQDLRGIVELVFEKPVSG